MVPVISASTTFNIYHKTQWWEMHEAQPLNDKEGNSSCFSTIINISEYKYEFHIRKKC